MTALHRILLFLAAALALGTGGAASAHLTPNSEVRLSFANDRVTADIIVPQGEYAYATGNPVGGDARSIALARRYLAERMRVTGEDGKAWAVSVGQPEFVQIEGPPDLHATATLVPPAGSDARAFDLEWHVLVDTLPNHFALVVVDAPGQEREIVGAVRAGTGPIRVDIHHGPLAVLGGAIALGAAHIATGFDHLLFLLALLLPAPLVARAGSWSDRRTLRGTLGVLARIVTAFTVGHSLTLVAATLGGWTLPVAPVEILIAISVLVSALHALRPLFPGREPLVAGTFGLVHGLAFATLVTDAGAGVASSAAGLLGFNLGIELVQLAVVLVVVPLLVLLSRRGAYTPFRIVGGIACAIAAGVWTVTRFGEAGFAGWSEAAGWAAGVATLAGVILLALAASRFRRTHPSLDV